MNAASEHRSGRYRIGDLVLDQAAGRVSRAGESLKVTGLTYDMLVALVEAAPSMLTYGELCEWVWGGRAYVSRDHGSTSENAASGFV